MSQQIPTWAKAFSNIQLVMEWDFPSPARSKWRGLLTCINSSRSCLLIPWALLNGRALSEFFAKDKSYVEE